MNFTRMRLICRGAALPDEETVSSHRLVGETVVHVVVSKVRGWRCSVYCARAGLGVVAANLGAEGGRVRDVFEYLRFVACGCTSRL